MECCGEVLHIHPQTMRRPRIFFIFIRQPWSAAENFCIYTRQAWSAVEKFCIYTRHPEAASQKQKQIHCETGRNVLKLTSCIKAGMKSAESPGKPPRKLPKILPGNLPEKPPGNPRIFRKYAGWEYQIY